MYLLSWPLSTYRIGLCALKESGILYLLCVVGSIRAVKHIHPRVAKQEKKRVGRSLFASCCSSTYNSFRSYSRWGVLLAPILFRAPFYSANIASDVSDFLSALDEINGERARNYPPPPLRPQFSAPLPSLGWTSPLSATTIPRRQSKTLEGAEAMTKRLFLWRHS